MIGVWAAKTLNISMISLSKTTHESSDGTWGYFFVWPSKGMARQDDPKLNKVHSATKVSLVLVKKKSHSNEYLFFGRNQYKSCHTLKRWQSADPIFRKNSCVCKNDYLMSTNSLYLKKICINKDVIKPTSSY